MKKICIIIAISLLAMVAWWTLKPREGVQRMVVEEVASGLEVPWSIAFTSEDRMLVTERPGRLRVIQNEVLLPQPLHVFPEVSTVGEEGLMSVVLDPEYDQSRFIYVSLAYKKDDGMAVKILRFRDGGSQLIDEKIILDGIPAAQYHAGCRMAFGPDGKLYITTGEATNGALAQDLKSLGGKILRINKDGTVPADNPFKDSPIWSYGHRNPQGIAWLKAKEMYSSEHGPSGFDGPEGGDEINHIMKGGNYGWPLVSHENKKEGTVAPIILFTPAEAPGSLLIYSGKLFPQFANNLFFGALRGEGIVRVVLDHANGDKVTYWEKLGNVRFGRIREVVESPDGSIYFSTSNRDGRGVPNSKDDRIFRVHAN
ncbi:MAG: PQQ-dependent sugar dehydrogenase [Patescibacteria group bacterium]